MRLKNNLHISLSFFLLSIFELELYNQGFVYACRSLKLGRVVRTAGSDSAAPLLSGSCLSPLAYNHGFLGYWIRYLFTCLVLSKLS